MTGHNLNLPKTGLPDYLEVTIFIYRSANTSCPG